MLDSYVPATRPATIPSPVLSADKLEGPLRLLSRTERASSSIRQKYPLMHMLFRPLSLSSTEEM